MSVSEFIKNPLGKILSETANNLNLTNYSLKISSNFAKGAGFQSEFVRVSIKDLESKKKIHLVVKIAPREKKRRENSSIEYIFKNEIHFYSKILPALLNLEKEYCGTEEFFAYPHYLSSSSTIGEEMIVLANIIKDGYVMRKKNWLLDEEHCKLAFETYAHFHSLSFCLKQRNVEEYSRLVQPLHRVADLFASKSEFIKMLQYFLKTALTTLDPQKDQTIISNFKKYVEDTKTIFLESSLYKGEYFCILHGDCWSNNMMFKYHDASSHKDVKGMKLLDFQSVSSGTPVYDLSYLLYCGGSRSALKNFRKYIDIYYDSFTKSSSRFGYDANILLPKSQLMEDWKFYARYGMMLSLMLIKLKLQTKKKEEMTSSNMSDVQIIDQETHYDENAFKEKVYDVLAHMQSLGAL